MSTTDQEQGDAEGHPHRRPSSYRHDPVWVPVLAEVADAACEGVSDPHQAGLRVERLLRQADRNVDEHVGTVLLHTFMYVIQLAPVAEQANATLEPLADRSLFPVALREAGDDIRTLWAELAPTVQHPVARARCWDIVFSLGLVRNRREAATHAVRAYLDTTTTTLSLLNMATGLVRAWTMIRLVRLDDLAEEVDAALAAVAEQAIAEQREPDAAIRALGALTSRPPRHMPAVQGHRRDDLLDRALSAYSQVHVIRDVATLVRRHAGGDSDLAERASRYEVEAMLAEAETARDPMIVRTLFHDAAAVARALGVDDLERVAIARLQAAPAVSWSSTQYSVTTPAPLFDHFLPGLRDAEDWRHALGIWLHSEAPSGSYEQNEAVARGSVRTSIRYRIGRVTDFRDGDLPFRRVQADQQIFDRELANIEGQHMGQNGRLLTKGLFQIRERFGIPVRADIEEFLHDVFGASPTLIRAWATAVQLFWAGEYDACCHLVVPKVEAAARALLLELNEPLYRAAVGEAVGQFPGLGSLLPVLVDNDFDPDWERFLRCLLLNDGQNMRNLVAHGFADNTSALGAALALRAGALLILVTNQDAMHRDQESVRGALSAPHGSSPSRRSGRRFAAAVRAFLHEFRR